MDSSAIQFSGVEDAALARRVDDARKSFDLRRTADRLFDEKPESVFGTRLLHHRSAADDGRQFFVFAKIYHIHYN